MSEPIGEDGGDNGGGGGGTVVVMAVMAARMVGSELVLMEDFSIVQGES